MQNLEKLPKKVCLISLGCKVNKYEIECMATILNNAGYLVTLNHEPSDYYVVNTCAVTNEGEKKSRQYISKLSKLNPNAKIVVCGCASQNNPEQFKKENVISVIGNEGKENILELINNHEFKIFDFPSTYNENINSPFKTQTRAYLKVQDGCNNFCSYCLIPYVRGRSRSRKLESVLIEAEMLAKTSLEIVVTGIDLSSYKIDGKPALGELVFALRNLPARIRLGSLEVNVITDDFMHFLLRSPNFCPQFHLSLQSGSNSVLKRMNRHYTTDEYLQKIELIKKYYPNANITTDVIVGFAGETDEEFEETLNTVKKAGFGNMHIFPYSKRAGTKAYGLKTPSGVVVKQRLKKLNDLKNELMLNYFNSIKNQTFNMLVEETEENYYVGYTENYVKAYLNLNESIKLNQIVKVKLTEPFKNGMKAELVLE